MSISLFNAYYDPKMGFDIVLLSLGGSCGHRSLFSLCYFKSLGWRIDLGFFIIRNDWNWL